MMAALFITILPLSWWRFGLRTCVLGLMEFTALGLAYVAGGNWLSVKQPFRMQFYRFSAGGSPVDALLGVIVGSVPGALTIYLLAREDTGAPWKVGLMMIVYLAICLFSVARFGRMLEAAAKSFGAHSPEHNGHPLAPVLICIQL